MIKVTDEHLRQQIIEEGQRRGHKSMSRTLHALLTERLTQLDTTRHYSAEHPVVRTGQGDYTQDWPLEDTRENGDES